MYRRAFEQSAAHWLALAHQIELLERRGYVRLFRLQVERE
jgi:hypothetical protein